MEEKESQGGSDPAPVKETAEECLERVKENLEEIKTYIETAFKTGKDAAKLEARLNLTSEERKLTAEEEGYKKNLQEDRQQTLEGLKTVEGRLKEIETVLVSISKEENLVSELKKCWKEESKYLAELEERIKAMSNEADERPF